jgi:hypothetical protein
MRFSFDSEERSIYLCVGGGSRAWGGVTEATLQACMRILGRVCVRSSHALVHWLCVGYFSLELKTRSTYFRSGHSCLWLKDKHEL